MQNTPSDICVYFEEGKCFKFAGGKRVCDLNGIHENGCWFIDILPNGERRYRATKIARKVQQLPLGVIRLFTEKSNDGGNDHVLDAVRYSHSMGGFAKLDSTSFKRMLFGDWSL
jgi:hypothetical protein